MNTSFDLRIITPERVFFSGSATRVTAPGMEGEFGVLPGHAPFISTLKAGLVAVKTASGEEKKVAILGGIAEVNQEHCSILAEVAQSLDGVTTVEAQAMLQAAQTAVNEAYNDSLKEKAAAQLRLAEIAVAAA